MSRSQIFNPLMNKSVHKSNKMIYEWRYHSEVLSRYSNMKCLCGFSRCSDIQYYKNIYNGCIIPIGSTCRNIFPDIDDELKEKTLYFTKDGYEKDNFVVDEEEIIESDEDGEIEEKYNEREEREYEEKYPEFEIEFIKEIKNEKYLVKWVDSEVSNNLWEIYIKLGYLDDVKSMTRRNNQVYIVWKDSWIDNELVQ